MIFWHLRFQKSFISLWLANGKNASKGGCDQGCSECNESCYMLAHGDRGGTEFFHVERNDTHRRTVMTAEHLWRTRSGCEHGEVVQKGAEK